MPLRRYTISKELAHGPLSVVLRRTAAVCALALVSATAHAQAPNRAPEAVGTFADLSLRPDEGPRTLNLSGAFSDPDGDALSLSAS